MNTGPKYMGQRSEI